MAPGSAISPTRRSLAWALRYLLPLVLFGLAVHIILPQIAVAEHSLQVIEGMVWWAVALAVVTQVLSYLGSGYLLKTLVAVAGQRLSVARGTAVFTAATSTFLVGGGPVGNVAVTFRWLRGSGVSPEAAVLAISLPTVFYDSAMALTGIIGLVQLLAWHQLSVLQTIGFGFTFVVLSLIAGVAVWGTRHRPQLTTLAARLARRWAALRRRPFDPAPIEAGVGRWFTAWDALRAGGWRGPMLGAVLNTGFDMLTLTFLFVAARNPVSPGVLLAGYGLPLLLGKVSFLPGGVGIVEATMAALYVGLGVPPGVAAIVILSYRFLSFWLPLLIGLSLVPYLQHVTRHSASGGPNDSPG